MSLSYNAILPKKRMLFAIIMFCSIFTKAQLPYAPLGPYGYYPGDRQIVVRDSSLYSIGYIDKDTYWCTGYWKDNEFNVLMKQIVLLMVFVWIIMMFIL